jgi:hypothetical protein
MIFEVDKYYEHNGGGMLHMLCVTETTGYGRTMLAEEFGSWRIIPCGMSEDNATNWHEISKEIWDACVQDPNKRKGATNDNKNGIHPSGNQESNG